jgi:hypothetical protein
MIAQNLSGGRDARSRPALAFPAPSAHWLALLVVLAGIALPDCCRNGRHLSGVGMDSFGPICRARL